MTSNYQHRKISADERNRIEKILIEHNKSLSEASYKIYGFSNIKRLRDDYKSGFIKLKHNKYAAARNAINWMIENEEKIILSFVAIAEKIVSSFVGTDLINSNTVDDLMQIAMMSMYDYIYEYNGKSKLISYLTLVIKCRLIDSQRSNKTLNGYNEEVCKIQKAVVKEMSEKGCSLNMAISQIQSNNPNISQKQWSRVYDLMTVNENFDYVIKDVPESNKDTNPQYIEIIEKSSLTNIEKELIYAHIQGEQKSYRSKLIQEINPNTGRFWTKQRLSQVFQNACKKLQSEMEKQQNAVA